MEQRLYRSTSEKIVGGVCGGLGEYFGVDPVLARLVFVVLAFGKGIGLVTYIVAWIIIPSRPSGLEQPEPLSSRASWTKYLPGLVVMAVGALLLIRDNFYWFDWDFLWPLMIIALGLVLVFRKTGSHPADESSQPFTTNHEREEEGPKV